MIIDNTARANDEPVPGSHKVENPGEYELTGTGNALGTVPEALLDALVVLDAAGGRITVIDGRLRIDVEQEIPDHVWKTLATHRDELVGSFTRGRPLWDREPIWTERRSDRRDLPLPAGIGCCDRCGSTESIDVEIHGGQSIRRDCRVCGRFLKFSRWYGVEMP